MSTYTIIPSPYCKDQTEITNLTQEEVIKYYQDEMQEMKDKHPIGWRHLGLFMPKDFNDALKLAEICHEKIVETSSFTIIERNGKVRTNLSSEEVVKHYQAQVSNYNELANTSSSMRMTIPDSFAEAKEVAQDFGDTIKDFEETDVKQNYNKAKLKFANGKEIKAFRCKTSNTIYSMNTITFKVMEGEDYHTMDNAIDGIICDYTNTDTVEISEEPEGEAVKFTIRFEFPVGTSLKEQDILMDSFCGDLEEAGAFDVIDTTSKIDVNSDKSEEFVVIDLDGKVLSYTSVNEVDFIDTVDDPDGGYSKAVLFDSIQEAKDCMNMVDLNEDEYEVMSAQDAFMFVEGSENLHWLDIQVDEDGKFVININKKDNGLYTLTFYTYGDDMQDEPEIDTLTELDEYEVREELKKYFSESEIDEYLAHVSGEEDFGWAVMYDYISSVVDTKFDKKVPMLVGKNLRNPIQEIRIYLIPDVNDVGKFAIETANGYDDIEYLVGFETVSEAVEALKDWHENHNSEHNLVDNFKVPDTEALKEFGLRINEFSGKME